MFGALEAVAEEHMEVQDHLNKVRQINQAKLVEREEAELEGQEVRIQSSCLFSLSFRGMQNYLPNTDTHSKNRCTQN
jgi:hypothetical protein